MKRRSADPGAVAVADAELQADVMRFVAILALCLVAISTLVETRLQDEPRPRETAPESTMAPDPESISGTSASPQATPDPLPAVGGADRSLSIIPEAVPVAGKPVVAEPHALDPPPAPARAGVVSRPSTVDGADASREPPARTDEGAPLAAAKDRTPSPPDPPAADRGLSLRFDSDAALLRMAARGEAGVYVLDGRQTLVLDLSDGVGFRPADPPASYYAISPATVPAVLRRAYRGNRDATWGVTLPDRTRAGIEAHLHGGQAGVLVIDAAGRVGLEAGDG